ncbi:MAG: protein translocase subunit SecD [Eubacteriales bacterium]|jgi:protein-export membrane protein SecD
MKNSVCSLILTLLCITLVVLVALFGIRGTALSGVFEEDTISKGLDLVGGSSITFKAIPEEGADVNMDEAVEKAINIMRKRLDGMNQNEATVSKVGLDSIRIEIPGVTNPEDAVKTLGSTAKLVFQDSDGNVVVEGKDVKSAQAIYGQLNQNSVGSEWYVSLEFNEAARASFADATERMAAKKADGTNYIAIKLDEETISRPSVEQRIDDTNCVISGSFDEAGAKELATLISSGQLPVAFEEKELRSVGASLGSDALRSSLVAGLIGVILVMVYMILLYRLPGFISCLALVAYTAIFGVVLAATKITLSLPGIAGIILTVGMAVDSNVVIYERIKEELRTGKTLRASVQSGFNRAFTAILDANVTTLIASVVLWNFGTGSVQGFAKTLFIGVVISLFTALVVTRVLLNAFVAFKVSPKLFGSAKKTV